MCCFLSVEFYAKWMNLLCMRSICNQFIIYYGAFLGKSKFCAKIRKTRRGEPAALKTCCFYRFTLTKKLTSSTGSVQNSI